MKTKEQVTDYFYIVALGLCCGGAESITIVKAKSLIDLKNKGFKKNAVQDVYRQDSIESAESFCKKYAPEYPKHRISYWI